MNLSPNLRNLMNAAGLGETGLAKKIGIPQPLIHRILSGDNTNPTLKTLQTISAYFSITTSQLVGEEPLAASISNTILTDINHWHSVPLVTEKNLTVTNKHTDYILVDHVLSNKAFSFVYLHENMEPAIPYSAVVVIDPELSFTHKDFVLTKSKDGLLIKYCLKKGNHNFLFASFLDFDTMEPFSTEDNIIGTIVRVIYGRNALHNTFIT